MVSLASLENKISKLVHQRDIIQRRESAKATKAIAQIRTLMSAHGLTVADLGKIPGKRGRPAKDAVAGVTKTAKTSTGKSKLPAKYRDPKTGAEWSGWARPPAWIANVKDRTKFLIDPSDTNESPKIGGRKPSAKTTVQPASRAASKTAVKTPGRRGRPPKNAAATKAATVKTAGKRGRPAKNAVAAEATTKSTSTKSLSSTKLSASPKKVTSSKAATASRKAASKTVKAAAAPKTVKAAKAPKATTTAKAKAAPKTTKAVKTAKPTTAAKPTKTAAPRVAKAARAPRKVSAPVSAPVVAEAPAVTEAAAA